MDIIIDGAITQNKTGLNLSTSSKYKIEVNSDNVKFYVDESGSGGYVEKHEESSYTPLSTYYPVFMAHTSNMASYVTPSISATAWIERNTAT